MFWVLGLMVGGRVFCGIRGTGFCVLALVFIIVVIVYGDYRI